MENRGNQVNLFVDLPFEDHTMMKWGLQKNGLNLQSVTFPDYLSNMVIIKGTHAEALKILSIMRKSAPHVAFIDLPDGFTSAQVLRIVEMFNKSNSVELRPFWSGQANSIYFFAKQENELRFIEVICEVLQFLQFIGVNDPPVYSPIRIDADTYPDIVPQIERLETRSPDGTSVSMPAYTGRNYLNSVFCISGRIDDVLEMKQKITNLLPMAMFFNYDREIVDEEFYEDVLEETGVKVSVSHNNVCVLTCPQKISGSLHYVKELMTKIEHEKRNVPYPSFISC